MKISNEAIRVVWNLTKKTNHVSALEMGIIQNKEKKLNQNLYIQSIKDDTETFY